MKVGFLVGSVSREAGGLFQSVRGLAKAVMCTNASARVFGISDEKSAVDLEEWQPLSVHTFRPQFRAWGYSNQLLPTLLGADLEILSIHGLWKYCSVASWRWHRRTGRPYIIHPHGMLESWALQNARWKKRIAALLYEDRHLRGAACLRALCEAEAHSIRAYGLRNPICVIPNGVEVPAIGQQTTDHRPPTTDIGPLTSGRKMLLYLGRLHPKKNVAALVKAWAAVQKSAFGGQKPGGWILAIAGWDQGGYERRLKQLVEENGLQFSDIRGQSSAVSRQWSGDFAADTAAATGLTSELGPRTSVAFLGPRFGPEKDAAYRACDAFILPSLSEGLPMAVLEAWAHAKPVLMTAECNLPEGFAAGAALQIGTSPEEIAAGLKQLTEMSDSDRTVMGGRGRTLAATKFSWPRIGEQMRAAYEWMLGGGTPPETVRLK
jgi:glycosyltransferase involved in cell wall biosynthesis